MARFMACAACGAVFGRARVRKGSRQLADEPQEMPVQDMSMYLKVVTVEAAVVASPVHDPLGGECYKAAEMPIGASKFEV